MKFDELLVKIGEFGPYQKRVFCLVSMAAVASAVLTLSPVFLLDIPSYSDGKQSITVHVRLKKHSGTFSITSMCAIPSYSNDTYAIQNDYHKALINLTIPLVDDEQGETTYSQCNLYNVTDFKPERNRTKFECDSWVYDTSVIQSSGITDFNMVCESEILRSHSNMVSFAGAFPGALVFGPLTDAFGRKKMLLVSVFLTVTTSVAVALAPTYPVYVAFIFFNSFCSMGLFMVAFVMAMEVVGPSKRTFVGMAIEFFWVGGLFALNAAAYFFREWRQLRLVIGVPPIVFLAYWWLVPESPRWLISKGRYEEAYSILRRIAKSNKIDLDDSLLKKVTVEKEEKKVRPWKILTSLVLLVRIIIMLFNWLTLAIAYYGLSLNVGNLSGDIYLNFFLSSLMELVAYLGCFFIMTRVGRKKMLCGSQLVGGVACLATIFPVVYGNASTTWMVTSLSMIGKLGSSAAYAIVYIYSAELMPTVLRQSGLGFCDMAGMAGGMIAPYIADLGLLLKGPLKDALPLIVFGALTVTAGLTACLLPETKDMILPETIEDAKTFGKHKRENTIVIEANGKSSLNGNEPPIPKISETST